MNAATALPELVKVRCDARPPRIRRKSDSHPAKRGPVRRGPRVELLELRSLLSQVAPIGSGGGAPDDADLVVDQEQESVVVHQESAGRLPIVLAVAQPGWVTGVIGDTGSSRVPSADVDVFQLELPGSERYSVRLDLLAHRLGSGLDGAVSVFDNDGELIATNDDGLGEYPSDAILNMGLDGGTYFIAVSEGGNVPGPDGFDLNVPGSGTPGRESTGRYVLRIAAEPDNQPPQVTSVSFDPGQTFDAPPTHIVVQFSEPMDPAGLVSGATLTSESGDQAELAAPTLIDQEPNDTHEAAQDLGNLFPSELADGVQLSGALSSHEYMDVVADGDFYRFRVAVPGLYAIRLNVSADATQAPGQFRLLDGSGSAIAERTVPPGTQVTMYRALQAGEYVLEIAGGGDATAAYEATVQSVLGVLGYAEIIPLTPSDFAGELQIVIRPGVAASPATSQIADSSVVVPLRDVAQAASVQSLPAVASEPVGGPGANRTDPTALAWVDQSDAAPLPAGFAMPAEPHGESVSVDRVSGSFLDPLAESVAGSTHALSPSGNLIKELAQLMRGATQNNVGVDMPVADTAASESGLMVAMDEDAEDEPHLALSPQALTITIVATLGAASAMTTSDGRRESDWLTHALGWLQCGA